MSVSRNLSSLGTLVTTSSDKSVTFANTISPAIFSTTNTNILNVTGNTNLKYILANSSLGSVNYILTSGGSASNVFWSSISDIIGSSSLTFTNAVTFSTTSTFNGAVNYNNTGTFNGAVTFSNTVTIANLNSTYVSDATFNNYKDQTYSNTTFGASYTVDPSLGSVQLLTLTSNTTISMPSANSGKSFTLILNTGSGGYAVTWNGVTWPDGFAPTVTTTTSKRDIFSFLNDGTNWYGFNSGQNF